MHLLRALALLLVVPAAAQAANIEVQTGQKLVVSLQASGTPAHAAASVLKLPDGGALVVLYGDVPASARTIGSGCAATSTADVPEVFSSGYGPGGRNPVVAATCTMTSVRAIEGRIPMTGGSGISWYSAEWALPTTIGGGRPGGTEAAGQTGAMTVTTGNGGDTILGSNGSDYLDPGGAPGKGEEAFGPIGNASLDDPGRNTVNALGGGDEVEMSRAPGVDLVNGGDGVDTVTWALRFATVGSPGAKGVNVSLDGVANDGDPDAPRAGTTTLGEADNIGADVENLIGTKLDDALIGNLLKNRFEGLQGVDTMRTGDGQDVIVSREPGSSEVGTADVISCGAASHSKSIFTFTTPTSKTATVPPDTLISDLADPRPFDCENIEQTAVDEGGAVRYPRLATLDKRGLTVQLSCPKAAQRRCRGELKLVAVKGSTSFAIASGAKRAVRLTAPKALRRAVEKRPNTQVHVEATETGNEGDVITSWLLGVS